MNKKIIERVLKESDYIINNKSTIRETSKVFKVSKSTVHKDMQDKLKYIDKNKYKKISAIFDNHIKIRHINGGNATKNKYLKLKTIIN